MMFSVTQFPFPYDNIMIIIGVELIIEFML